MSSGGPFFNGLLNELISVGFIVGFFGCIGLSIYQAIKGNWNVSMLALLATLLLWQQIPTFIGDGHYWHRDIMPF
jgi:hypothetical protein